MKRLFARTAHTTRGVVLVCLVGTSSLLLGIGPSDTFVSSGDGAQYRVIKEHGSGSYGDVFRAFRTEGGEFEPVAIKVIRDSLTQREKDFVLEGNQKLATACKTGCGPAIHKLLEVAEFSASTGDEKFLGILSELADGDGKELETHLRIGEFPDVLRRLEALVTIYNELGAAVLELQSKEVVHSDIKPGNLLVIGSRLVLADFDGVATIGQPFRITSPKYEPLEALLSMNVAEKSDFFILGNTLAELMSGLVGRDLFANAFLKRFAERDLYGHQPQGAAQNIWQSKTLEMMIRAMPNPGMLVVDRGPGKSKAYPIGLDDNGDFVLIDSPATLYPLTWETGIAESLAALRDKAVGAMDDEGQKARFGELFDVLADRVVGLLALFPQDRHFKSIDAAKLGIPGGAVGRNHLESILDEVRSCQ